MIAEIYPLFGQEFARIIKEHTHYEITSSNDVTIKGSYKMKINSKNGMHFAYFTEYVDKFRKLKNIKITVLDSNGIKIKKLSKGDGHEYGFNSSYEIDDSKMFVIDPNYSSFPFYIEAEYEISIKGFISLPTWIPRSTYNLAIEKADFTIKYPSKFDLNLREEHITPVGLNIEGKNEIKYSVSNLKAVDKVVRYKDFYNNQPKVRISPTHFSMDGREGNFDTWASFGDWFYDLNNDPYTLTETTKNFIDSLSKKDLKIFIRSVYKYMQERTRYVSIQLGIGGYKSISTEDVEATGYGDCKALTTYMKNMLDYGGINSNYILVRAGRESPDVVSDFPSNQFNHVYLGIPLEDTLYLECTSQTIPAFYTGKFTDDRNVLWIDQGRSTILRSKVYKINENVQINKSKIELSENGDAKIEIETDNQGVFYDDIAIFQSGANDYIQQYNEDNFWFKDFTIKDFSFSQKNKDEAIFKSKYKLSVLGIAKKVGQRLVIPINFLKPTEDIIDEDQLKKYAQITRAFNIEDSVKIYLPRNFWIHDLPDKFSLDTKYGTYEYDIQFDNNILTMLRSIKMKKGEYLNTDYERFNKFFDQIKKFEKKKLLLTKET